MDVGRVLGRALELAWRWKFLWVFGFIMALTGGGGFSSGTGYRSSSRDFTPGQPPSSNLQLAFAVVAILLAVAACLLLLYLVLVFYARFVARGALVSAIRSIENGGTTNLRSAWREGQRYYGRLLGLGFLVGLPLAIFSIVLVVLGILPFVGSLIVFISSFGSGARPNPDVAPFAISALGASLLLLCCAVVLISIIRLLIHPVYEFAVRAIVLEDAGIVDGLKRGWRRLRENLSTAGLLYVALLGARLLWWLGQAIVFIPIALVFAAILIAAVSADVIAGIFVAIAFGIPLFLLYTFVEGLFEVFESNAWTEGYISLLGTSAVGAPAVQGPISPAESPQAV